MLHLVPQQAGTAFAPLDRLTLLGAGGRQVVVRDAAGREYARVPATPEAGFVEAGFVAGGALGTQIAEVLDGEGKPIDSVTFQVQAQTMVDDGGPFRKLFEMARSTLYYEIPEGRTIEFRGRKYRYWMWLLDHYHMAKGMKFLEPYAGELIDLLAMMQREDGMVHTFAAQELASTYFESAYGRWGYAVREGDVQFVRQPAENHVEYIYVNLVHLCWKSSGDLAWMAGKLDSAARALDYAGSDRDRWSERFGLLKRGYTIDSWDFQVRDEYTPYLGIGNDMLIDPDRTRFGIFYGDNTGYIEACRQLAEMMERTGRTTEAQKYRERGDGMLKRLNDLAWNGRFFQHRIEEDPAVVRNLGVDEKSQISHSNMYSINRGLPHEQCVAIIKTYLDLRDHLPPGSPGEWYAIYPPFERGFEAHNAKWQYMNGGIAGHAIGELARGALEHGFEEYGVDSLRRQLALGEAYTGRLDFAYTGAYPPPPEPVFQPLDLSRLANMDLWDQGAPDVPGWLGGEPGNDMRGLPTGDQTFAGIPFHVVEPGTNGRRSVVAISRTGAFPAEVTVPVSAPAVTVYLLHTMNGGDSVAGSVTFHYENGAEASRYLRAGVDVAGWWFPGLGGVQAGVAWSGPNLASTDVGVCWAALANPYPDKPLRALTFSASLENATYVLLGVTPSDLPHFVRPHPVSFGGPDQWTGGTTLGALVEGLAGITDMDTVYRRVRIAPRWTAARTDRVKVTARYAASSGYVSYEYRHDAAAREIALTLTGSGDEAECRVLLPAGVRAVRSVRAAGDPIEARIEVVEQSHYAVFPVALPGPLSISMKY